MARSRRSARGKHPRSDVCNRQLVENETKTTILPAWIGPTVSSLLPDCFPPRLRSEQEIARISLLSPTAISGIGVRRRATEVALERAEKFCSDRHGQIEAVVGQQRGWKCTPALDNGVATGIRMMNQVRPGISWSRILWTAPATITTAATPSAAAPIPSNVRLGRNPLAVDCNKRI